MAKKQRAPATAAAKSDGASAAGPPAAAANKTASATTSGSGSSSSSSVLSPSSVAVAVLLVAVGVCLSPYGRQFIDPYLSPFLGTPELRLFAGPKVTSVPELADRQYQDRMLWGTYRSGLYLGMRTRQPKSLVTGLMWFDPDDPETLRQMKIRHEARQEDGLTSYGWLRHDGATYGRQVLLDDDYNITTSVLKHAGPDSGLGGDWALRVSVSHARGRAAGMRRRPRVSLIFYIGDEDEAGSSWNVLPNGEPTNLTEPLTLLQGVSSTLGPWSLHLRGDSKLRPNARLDFLSVDTEKHKRHYLLHVKQLAANAMYERMERQPPSADAFELLLPNGVSTSADLAMFQVTLTPPGTFDIVYASHKNDMINIDDLKKIAWGIPTKATTGKNMDTAAALAARVQDLSGKALSEKIVAAEQAFEDRFATTFLGGPSAAAGLGAEAGGDMARAALSNLLGSMGYFYGQSAVHVAGREHPELYPAAPLFTAVPSRSFFPRGFLWDEGFHQLLVARWDGRVSRDALAHWLDLMNVQGWIPREQILGDDAISRVPKEFVVQDPHHANPPSLFLPLAHMLRTLRQHRAQEAQQAQKDAEGTEGATAAEAVAVEQFLTAAWPRLKTWYNWFNTTQAGQLPGTYRWHGRNASAEGELNPKTLTSGLDDYPRASHPTDDERHLDLRCWMMLASEVMAAIGEEALRLPPSAVAPYRATAAALRDEAALTALHFDPATGQFADWGLHSEDVKLVTRTIAVDGQPQEVTVRQVLTPPTRRFVPQYGYVSLFPLLMKALAPGSPLLGPQLELLRQEAKAWSPHGLRSLAADASLYKRRNTPHDPPYWRGQVWLNINYLALSALHHYSQHDGSETNAAATAAAQRAGELYRELRANVLGTVLGQYSRRGYLYEQYDDTTGLGTSSHPFTGWTALVALIATESY